MIQQCLTGMYVVNDCHNNLSMLLFRYSLEKRGRIEATSLATCHKDKYA
jgi:hypothetical protein